MESSLVLFAIEAGVRLGQKLNQVLLDETVERPLLLPVGNLFADVQVVAAKRYFAEHPELTGSGGPYRGFDDAGKVAAYRTILVLEQRIGDPGGVGGDAVEIVTGLARFDQFKQSFGANHPLQRALGTVVEIGIEYFVQNPGSLGKSSPKRKLLEAFVRRLDEVEFAEGSQSKIIGDVVLAGLNTLDEHISLIDDDQRFQVLVGGVTKALVEEVETAGSNAVRSRREGFVRRIASSILRGGATAFTENLDLFLGHDSAENKLVHATLTQVLEGVRGNEDLFTNESLELLFSSALEAIGENAELVSDQAILRDLIRSTVKAVTDTQGRKLFSEETAAAILAGSLEVLRDHMEVLIPSGDPGRELLSGTLKAMALGLASSLSGGGTARDLLSKGQLVELAQLALDEVARHPEQLLGGEPDGQRKLALTQIIASVARALGDEPSRFVSGAGLLELLREAIQVTVQNADKLLNLDTADPQKNLLFQVIRDVVEAVGPAGDPRRLVGQDVFLETIRRLLPVVSANLEGLAQASGRPVFDAMRTVLRLAAGALEGRINGANLPGLVAEIVLRVLWNELSLEEATAVEQTARLVLRGA